MSILVLRRVTLKNLKELRGQVVFKAASELLLVLSGLNWLHREQLNHSRIGEDDEAGGTLLLRVISPTVKLLYAGRT